MTWEEILASYGPNGPAIPKWVIQQIHGWLQLHGRDCTDVMVHFWPQAEALEARRRRGMRESDRSILVHWQLLPLAITHWTPKRSWSDIADDLCAQIDNRYKPTCYDVEDRTPPVDTSHLDIGSQHPSDCVCADCMVL